MTGRTKIPATSGRKRMVTDYRVRVTKPPDAATQPPQASAGDGDQKD